MKLALLNLSIPLLLISVATAFSPSQLNQRRGRRSHHLRPTNDRRLITTSTTTHQNNAILNNSKDITFILFAAAKVGIFFGTSTGNTENVADMIAARFGADAEGPFEIDELQGSIADKFAEYDALVVGTPTWNTGADSERSGTGWDEVYYGEMQGSFFGVRFLFYENGDINNPLFIHPAYYDMNSFNLLLLLLTLVMLRSLCIPFTFRLETSRKERCCFWTWRSNFIC